ncbi:MFS transporter [Kitasatospora mediocidica]|uniref:MFS transporter n=1 Tax=Kitasatospora mediocidica TaxID=58352 RepID=UPI000B2DDBBE|nr:MFS transporter [Kitasatospora mediocidica]
MIELSLAQRMTGRITDALPPRGPQRSLLLSSFVNRVGNGLFNTASVLYFTRVVHLSAAQVGLGLTIAGVVGLFAGIPAGDLADRRGPRGVMMLTLAVQALTMTAFVFVHAWGAFTLIASLDLLAASANNAARGALIARVGGDRPAAFRARLRTFVNVGVVCGTLGAAFAVQIDSRAAYTALILANAASYVGCGLLLLRVPNYQALPRPKRESRWAALADRPFALFALLDGAMGLQYPVASLLLPIWIAAHTHAPRWTVAAVYAVNSAVCALFQLRIGSAVETPRQGGRALRLAGLLFLLSCPLMALTADVPPWAAIVLLLVAITVHSVGEVWQSSAGFALGFGLAPEHAQGQYQGLVGLGFDTGQALAPALLATVCLGLGQLGWLLLGVFFAVLGLLGPPLTAWAERTRPPAPAASTSG